MSSLSARAPTRFGTPSETSAPSTPGWRAASSPSASSSATFEVRPDGDGSRIVWPSDVVPDEVGPAVRGMVEAGSRAIADTLAGSA